MLVCMHFAHCRNCSTLTAVSVYSARCPMTSISALQPGRVHVVPSWRNFAASSDTCAAVRGRASSASDFGAAAAGGGAADHAERVEAAEAVEAADCGRPYDAGQGGAAAWAAARAATKLRGEAAAGGAAGGGAGVASRTPSPSSNTAVSDVVRRHLAHWRR